MQDQDRTREQLIEELNEMRSSKIELEPTNTKPQAPKPEVPDHENPSPETEVLISSKVRDNPEKRKPK